MKNIPFICEKSENSKGLKFNSLYKEVSGNSNGINITGLIGLIVKDSKGLNISGLATSVGRDSKGANISGVITLIEGYSKGLNISGGYNHAGKSDGFLIQYGTIANNLKEFSEDSVVLQIGLYNAIGSQYSFIMNVKGLKNFPKQFKKLFTKKNIEKKVLQVPVKRY